MNNWKLLVREITHRKMNFALTMVAITVAATLFVAGPTLMEGYQRESRSQLELLHQETEETLNQIKARADDDLTNLDKRTKQIMRDLGFNLRIIHKNTDLSKLYANFVSFDMPESYVQRLADSPEITKIVHLVATLRQMIDIDGKPRLLVGFAPEATQSHIEQKAPMGFRIVPGTVYLGHLAADGHKVGDTLEILGQEFQVARILAPRGTREEDIAIAMHLKDAQRVLDKEGLISEIVALGCKCKTIDRVEEIMQQLELVLPEAQVIELTDRAVAREQQRKLVTRHYEQQMVSYTEGRDSVVSQQKESHSQVMNVLAGLNNKVIPMVVLACITWAGLLAWSNVRQRRVEIGLLRALGKDSFSIVSLLLGKAVIVGAIGGVIGSGLGVVLAGQLGQSNMLAVSTQSFQVPGLLLIMTCAGAPVLCALASYLPTLLAVQQDPAVVLMDE